VFLKRWLLFQDDNIKTNAVYFIKIAFTNTLKHL